jgi:hypothetical protein
MRGGWEAREKIDGFGREIRHSASCELIPYSSSLLMYSLSFLSDRASLRADAPPPRAAYPAATHPSSSTQASTSTATSLVSQPTSSFLPNAGPLDKWFAAAQTAEVSLLGQSSLQIHTHISARSVRCLVCRVSFFKSLSLLDSFVSLIRYAS